MRVGVISRLSLSRRGLCALIASSKNCSIELDLPAIPEDVEVLRKAQLEVLLLHASEGDSDFEAVSRLRTEAPEIKILLFMDAADAGTEFQAVLAGSCGCVSNGSDLDTLLKAIGAVGKGEIWVSRPAASRLISKLSEGQANPNSPGLSPREWKILGLLASGTRNKEIASRLSVSENTVKTHLYRIYRKINVDCRLAATLYYFQYLKSYGAYPHNSAPPQGKLKKKANVCSGQGENSPARQI
jgi:DNA-binding NarL/FixJ family response regulator